MSAEVALDDPVVARAAVLAGRARMPMVRRAAAACRACELWARATRTVFGEGPVPARLMLVGEQPGDREDRSGHPFVGPAGRMLDEALAHAGIERDAVFVTNVVKHFRWRPAAGSKRRLHERPTRGNVRACRPWIDSEIALVHPAAIVLMGATAVEALAGPTVRLTRDRGRALVSDLAPVVVATIHPSAILRSRGDRAGMLDELVRDLRVAVEASAA